MAEDASGAGHQGIGPRGSPSQVPSTAPASWGRKQLASLYDVFVLTVTMLDAPGAQEILRLAMDAVPRLTGCRPRAATCSGTGASNSTPHRAHPPSTAGPRRSCPRRSDS
ncbi:hypothetical protein ACFQ51_47775 [Streptomyces kaempferi]